MSRKPISAHFAAAEFDCHNGQQWPEAARDALVLWAAVWGEPLRAQFGPVTVLSGYRPRAYNAQVGGAPESYHRYELRYGPQKGAGKGVGVAVDVRCARGTPQQWAAWGVHRLTAALTPLGSTRGACVPYPGSGFVHLDTGPRRAWAG